MGATGRRLTMSMTELLADLRALADGLEKETPMDKSDPYQKYQLSARLRALIALAEKQADPGRAGGRVDDAGEDVRGVRSPHAPRPAAREGPVGVPGMREGS
jgi:hypothetical protein